VKPAPSLTHRLALEETEEGAMSSQTSTHRPVQLPARSIVLLIMVLAVIVVIVAASGWLGARTSTTPAGVHETALAAQPLTSPTQEAVVVGQGVYLVGSDIPGGTYKGKATRAPAYWQTSLDAQGSLVVEGSGRLSGEFFYVRVAKGQYLHVVGAQLIRLN
jgi:hypothetical protein